MDNDELIPAPFYLATGKCKLYGKYFTQQVDKRRKYVLIT